MAFTPNTLTSIAKAGGGAGLHMYKTDDADTDVETDGYFDSVGDLFDDGDVLIAALDLNGTAEVKVYVVMVNDAKTDVTLTAMLIA